MGSLYRSEEMCLAQIFLQSEAAYSCVAELGELGLVQFRDLNPDVNAFQRKFVSEVRRCDEMERRLRFFEKEVTSSGISILNTGENPNAPAPREMIDLEACFEKLENELKEVNTNQEALMRNFLELTELKHILQNTQTFFSEGNRPDEAFGFSDMQLGFVTGVIRRERIPAFEQMLWRVCRGNVFLRQAEIEEPLKDPSTGEEVWKSVFIIFFQGDQLKIRVKKICEGFRATLYPCNETAAERAETSMAVLTRLEDLQKVLSQTEEHRQRLLSLASKSLRVWFIKVRKLKAIYHTLNLFNLDVTQKCLIAECWCPVSDLDQINLALRRGTEVSGSSVPSILNRITTDEEPPTYNKTNKFTKVYQSLVDSYGVANYREVNPAPFTIITYPFLFSVMYGDMGHGLIMFLFGLWLVVREKQLHASLANHEMFGMLYGGRYVIMLMGLFSVYSGFLYRMFGMLYGGRYVIMLMGLFSVYSGFLYNDCLSNSGNRPDEAFGFSDMQLGFVTGVIRRERIPAFEQMLWRVCRGNVFLRQAEIEEPLKDPSTGEEVWKSVFIIFFQGDQLKIRVKKICEGFRATLYPCNETAAERAETSMAVLTRLEDLQKVLSQTEEHRQRLLSLASKSLRVWFIKVRKLKAIYHTLNLFNLDVTQKCLIAECWCPVSDLDQINLALRRGTEVSGSSVPSILNRITTDEEPPTYNKTNKFTKVYQSLVDSYGVANYREVNPAPFTIITYPFLFSVMYGDMGHGLIMFLFGLWLVVREKQLHASLANHEMFGMLYGGRYVIMLMGLFSVYSGFLYNDCLSNSVNIFGSTWNATNMNYSDELLSQDISLGLDPKYSATGAVYPIGIDPMWQLSTNSINFLNSYKMKLSVILGVSQMTFGVFLSFCNHRYFKRSLNIWGEFVPQLIFMISIFGYLVVLIFVKWLIYDVWNENSAPSLILTLINMGLLTPPDPPMFPGQPSLQIFLVLLAVSCIPWMLFVKPVVLYLRHQNRPLSVSIFTYLTWPNRGTADASGLLSSDTQAVINQDELAINNSDAEDPETSNHLEQPASLVPKEFDFGETFIYQAIHTIEYCLGCISHTASYLRLWALSLAHSELSEVLWNMLLAIGLRMNGFVGSIATFGCFGAWAILTVGILLFMEGLSAFLHTLRLHWIEFQSKFYKGEGHPFLPFTFDAILEGKEE
eukprot:XP_011664912.1 PREDICTED: V-type proton ATPase 116 kDa subunit a isoform 1 [Strongylocentrotus purpuratus]